MAAKRTSEVARGTGSSPAAPIGPSQATSQPIPEPAAPRDVPEPLGDLPPENVGRSDGASTNRKSKDHSGAGRRLDEREFEGAREALLRGSTVVGEIPLRWALQGSSPEFAS